MDKINKIVHMANGEKMIIPKPTRYFTLREKHHIIQEYFSSCISKNLLWKKYTGKPDHGRLLIWIRKLGYGDAFKKEKAKFAMKTPSMDQEKIIPSQQAVSAQGSNLEEQHDQIAQLQKQLQLAQHQLSLSKEELVLAKKELGLTKKDLELAQIKAIAYSTMIDLAEKEFNIPIRKK